jgi:hypothetical protein
MLVRPRASILAALATAIIAAGCGDNSSISATGPSASSNGSAGAVIVGQVTGATADIPISAGSFSRLADRSLTVRVMGTDIATAVDGQGRFTLTGVPGGTIQLQFTGPNTNALVTLAGISPSDRIEITVHITGNNARLDSERRRDNGNGNGVQVNGRIASRDVGARTFVVNGSLVSVPPGTTIRHGNRTFAFSDLRVGDHVIVKGTWNGGMLVASEVKIADEDDDDDD